MAIKFDENGKIVLNDADALACPADPMDALQCDSCQ